MSTPDEPKQRLRSLDALRGFDMFWIIGGSGFFLALLKWLTVPDSTIEAVATQFTHVEWEGFRFFDLIFPLFVFLAGVSIPYAVLSLRDKGGSRSRLQLKILKRSAILILLGLSFSAFKFQPDQIRFYTVLWLIGVAYLLGSSISLHVKKWRTQAIIVFAVLLSYHLALVFLPYPGKAAEITASNNLAACEIDLSFLFTHGSHRLDIHKFKLFEDGKLISENVHTGTTGGNKNENTYQVQLKQFENKKRYTLRFTMNTDGGTESDGKIQLRINKLSTLEPTKKYGQIINHSQTY